jgi:hypothetical protein
VKWDLRVLAVNFRSGRDEYELLLFAGSFQDHLRAVYIGFDGPYGALDDEFDANRRGEMNNHVRIIHKFREQMTVFDAVEVIFEKIRAFQMPDVFHASGRKIIEENYPLALFEESLRQMRTDKTSTAGN